ncbi:uncharacterized protein LOC141858583 [Brevipalpus obovatus]|uniref:uncharacterized protein LOC141858583 n=1 Tax=Brevipalpus obovatus TaxID=246614 RepID=UPI003D9F5EE6
MLLFFFLFSLFSASQCAEISNFTILCLDEGRNYAQASEKLTCDRDGFKKVEGILKQEILTQRNCAELFMFSCRKFLDFRLCLIGVQTASLKYECSKEYDFDERKVISKCCDACKLGSKMALAEGICSAPNNIDPSVEAALHLCCKKTLNSKNHGNSVPALTLATPNPITTLTHSTSLLSSLAPLEVTSTGKPNTSRIETSSQASEASTTPKPSSTSTKPPQTTSTTSTTTTTTSTSTAKPNSEVSRNNPGPVSLANVSHSQDEIPKSITLTAKTSTTPPSIAELPEYEKTRNLLPEERECLKISSPYSDFESECKCPEGFKVKDSMEGICEDINECSDTSHSCENDDSCSNTIGGFTCSKCSEGLILHNGACVSEVPKSLDNSTEIPIEVSTFPHRECSPGFQHNVFTDNCEDLDECNQTTGSCSNPNDCVNTNGSYVCRSSDCKSGYAFNNQTCANLECMKGFHFDQDREVCVEINECLNYPSVCSSGSWCHNLRGNFECKCAVGFQRSSQQNDSSCEDIDECALELHNCWGVQKCFNFIGGFECALNGENFSDFIENVEPNMVFPPEGPGLVNIASTENIDNSTCLGAECWKFKETYLAYYCVSLNSSKDEPQYRCNLKLCPEKYSLGREWECIPSLINFSNNTTTASPSPPVSRSESSIEGDIPLENVTKMCQEGFVLLDGACVDVDECNPKYKYCPEGKFCINTNGSYICKECPLGERVAPGKEDCSCNHEECSKFNGRSCQSVGAGFEKCFCSPEYYKDSRGEHCYPRCPLGSSLNFHEIPTKDCQCPETHKKHGNFCLKLCSNTDDCEGGECITHEDQGLCACPKGFKLDHEKEQCIDIDECKSKELVCHREDVCANFPGGHSCLNFDCDQGFTPQQGLGRCLKEANGRKHFIRKAALGRMMKNVKENQTFLTSKLPKAFKLEQREVKINPKEFDEYIQVSIQSENDGAQVLVMKTIKPFHREGNVTIDVIAETSENTFTYELRTNLYISRLPFTLDMIGHD